MYVGKINEKIALFEEAHPLEWLSAEENHFDCRRFAGKGNIGHMVEQVKTYVSAGNNTINTIFEFTEVLVCVDLNPIAKLETINRRFRVNYIIRKIRKDEYSLLDEFLYEAIYIPNGVEEPPKSIIKQPELQVYISGFGKKDDNCLVAEVDGKVIGAVWARIMNDYGHIDDDIPSFAISLYKEFRGIGIGTTLMKDMLILLKSKGYEKTSLSVQKKNYAYELYRKVGFKIVGENEEEFVMVRYL